MFGIKSSRVTLWKLCCEAGAHFAMNDSIKDAIVADGHCFLRTRFWLRSEQGTSPVYYCKCGEMAVRHETGGQRVCCLADDGCECSLTHCCLPEADRAGRPATGTFRS